MVRFGFVFRTETYSPLGEGNRSATDSGAFGEIFITKRVCSFDMMVGSINISYEGGAVSIFLRERGFKKIEMEFPMRRGYHFAHLT